MRQSMLLTVCVQSIIIPLNITISLQSGVVRTAPFLYTGRKMEYTPLESTQYYSEANTLVEGLGCILIELQVVRTRSAVQVRAVIAKPACAGNENQAIHINDCAKVHRLLLPRFEALLHSQDIFMEVTSPGMNRTIKNAAEFALFAGKTVRIWDRACSDWISGVIESSCAQSLTLTLSGSGETKTFAYEHIAKAKLADTEG